MLLGRNINKTDEDKQKILDLKEELDNIIELGRSSKSYLQTIYDLRYLITKFVENSEKNSKSNRFSGVDGKILKSPIVVFNTML